MKHSLFILTCSIFLSLVTLTSFADDDENFYEITVTNLTKGQILSPLVVATHRHGVKLFTLGEAASPELAAVAQDADSDGLVNMLMSNPSVNNVTVSANGVILPGASDTVMVPAMGKYKFISLASMLVTTNDAFIALNGVAGPKGKHTKMKYSPAYDAGSEANSESCAHIPGPPCGNPHMSPEQDSEGYVYIHSGIHGVGDLDPAMHDWRNPVAKISIRRVH